MRLGKTSAPAGSNVVPPSKRKVFLVDDHPIVRNGIAHIINGEPDLQVVGQAGSSREAIDGIKAAMPDITLLDISMSDADGINLAKELLAHLPNLAILMFSMHDETMYAERCLRVGARGYVMKQEPPATLLGAIRHILDGEVYLSPRMSKTSLQRMSQGKKAHLTPMERLTSRELEVFRMIGGGDSVHVIAAKLSLSNKTVEAHREHIKEKWASIPAPSCSASR
jgi:DNA-binding NarL/FixJ family response regulator